MKIIQISTSQKSFCSNWCVFSKNIAKNKQVL